MGTQVRVVVVHEEQHDIGAAQLRDGHRQGLDDLLRISRLGEAKKPSHRPVQRIR